MDYIERKQATPIVLERYNTVTLDGNRGGVSLKELKLFSIYEPEVWLCLNSLGENKVSR